MSLGKVLDSGKFKLIASLGSLFLSLSPGYLRFGMKFKMQLLWTAQDGKTRNTSEFEGWEEQVHFY